MVASAATRPGQRHRQRQRARSHHDLLLAREDGVVGDHGAPGPGKTVIVEVVEPPPGMVVPQGEGSTQAELGREVVRVGRDERLERADRRTIVPEPDVALCLANRRLAS